MLRLARLIRREEMFYPASLFIIVMLTGCATLSGCNFDVPRPDTNLCLNNVAELSRTCYNLLRDYDQNGNLSKNAKPVVTYYESPIKMLAAIHKSFSTDPDGWANLKAYLRDLRAANQ